MPNLIEVPPPATNMRVLLFDTTAYEPVTPLFLSALRELAGNQTHVTDYCFVDEAGFGCRCGSLLARAARRILKMPPLDRANLNRSLLQRALVFKPSAVLVCKGAYLFPETLASIKRETGAALINYATDDPFNPRACTRELIASIPLYDVYACTKRAIMDDVRNAGCKNVIYLPFAYKPEVHFPEVPREPEDVKRFACDIAFIGGCDSDRIPYFTELLRRIPNLNLRLYGGYWNRHPVLRRYWRGFVVGREFRMAIGGAKISLNLVRRANRDGHVMRSFEIPACGGFMLAESTSEHLEIFGSTDSAVYFSTPEELAAKAEYYLPREEQRAATASRFYTAITTAKHSYLDRVRALLDLCFNCAHTQLS